MSRNNGETSIPSSVTTIDQSSLEVYFQNDEMMISIAKDHTNSILSFTDGSELFRFSQLMEINPRRERIASIKKEDEWIKSTWAKRSRKITGKDIDLNISQYQGVTKCSNNQYEAFLWEYYTRRSGRGKRVYIGRFESEVQAAIAHDLIAIKTWGESTLTNFPVSDYSKQISQMKSMSMDQLIFNITKTSKKTGAEFVRVTRVDGDKWEVRLENGNGRPSYYLGLFDTKEEATRAYNKATKKVKEENVSIIGPSNYRNVTRPVQMRESFTGGNGSNSGGMQSSNEHDLDIFQEYQYRRHFLRQHDDLNSSAPIILYDFSDHSVYEVGKDGNGSHAYYH